jgi:putative membrane protein
MPYDSLIPGQLSLRDVLARDRTVLANERTLLAYLRTGLMLLVTGATLFKLMYDDGAWVVITAAFLVLAGISVVVIGIVRFNAARKHLAAIYAKQQT